MEQTVLGMQRLAWPLADLPVLHYPLVGLYRLLTQKMGLSVGSSVGRELTGSASPPGFLKKMGTWQRRGWEAGLARLADTVQKRQLAAAGYDRFFERTPSCPPYAAHAMLRYALLVRDKESLLGRAEKLRIPIGDWFLSPLHPVQGDLSPWGYQPGQCPAAEQACREVINLLTDHLLSDRQLTALFADEL